MVEVKRQFQVLDSKDNSHQLKVAFATSDRQTVDQHFGSARSFAIYGVDLEESRLITVSEFGELKQDGNEDKLHIKLQTLEGCIAVYCRACGASAVRQLLALGIQPVKVSEANADIHRLLEDLKEELRDGPSSWLARAIKNQQAADSKRFDLMANETWDE